MIQSSIQGVLSLQDLQPSPAVNKIFSQLVDDVVGQPHHARFEPSVCEKIQDITSRSETEMEIYWAKRIIASSDPHETLQSFPYTENYAELVRREIELLERSGIALTSKSSVLMVGTGPLPLTALELMRQRGTRVDHVDISAEALALCSLVGQRLSVECGHITGDGAGVRLENTYDVVIIAGLAGSTLADKQAILDNILPSLAANGRVLVRSSYGARSLLYPSVKAQDFKNVELLEEYHPEDYVINSVFVYKKENT